MHCNHHFFYKKKTTQKNPKMDGRRTKYKVDGRSPTFPKKKNEIFIEKPQLTVSVFLYFSGDLFTLATKHQQTGKNG